MSGLFIRLLRNRYGYTATECGLMVALIVIAVEQLASRF